VDPALTVAVAFSASTVTLLIRLRSRIKPSAPIVDQALWPPDFGTKGIENSTASWT
jgi:hypothetical protein